MRGDQARVIDFDNSSRQIISRAVASEGVMNIFSAAGLDISVLSDEFLSEVQRMPYRNLAVELPRKLLRGEVSTCRRKNVCRPAHSPRCWSRR